MSRIETYRACAARGMSIPATARLHGVSEAAVRQANDKHFLGFKTATKNRSRSPDVVRAKLEDLVAAGKSQREIALSFRAPSSTVRTWCRTFGIRNPKWRSRSGSGRKPLMPLLEPFLTEQEAADLKLLRRKGYRFKEALVAIKRADLLEGLK